MFVEPTSNSTHRDLGRNCPNVVIDLCFGSLAGAQETVKKVCKALPHRRHDVLSSWLLPTIMACLVISQLSSRIDMEALHPCFRQQNLSVGIWWSSLPELAVKMHWAHGAPKEVVCLHALRHLFPQHHMKRPKIDCESGFECLKLWHVQDHRCPHCLRFQIQPASKFNRCVRIAAIAAALSTLTSLCLFSTDVRRLRGAISVALCDLEWRLRSDFATIVTLRAWAFTSKNWLVG